MRRVLKRREIVADDWRHFGEAPAASDAAQGLIVALARAARQPPNMVGISQGNLGLRIGLADKIEDLAFDLARFALIAVEFPAPGKGAATRRAGSCAGGIISPESCAPWAPPSNAISSSRSRAAALMPSRLRRVKIWKSAHARLGATRLPINVPARRTL
jgi:hypothetical protein